MDHSVGTFQDKTVVALQPRADLVSARVRICNQAVNARFNSATAIVMHASGRIRSPAPH
jgi:hypothetical protein